MNWGDAIGFLVVAALVALLFSAVQIADHAASATAQSVEER